MNDKDKEAMNWNKQNPPGRLRFTMLMREDVEQHDTDIRHLDVNGTEHSKMMLLFINTFGEPK